MKNLRHIRISETDILGPVGLINLLAWYVVFGNGLFFAEIVYSSIFLFCCINCTQEWVNKNLKAQAFIINYFWWMMKGRKMEICVEGKDFIADLNPGQVVRIDASPSSVITYDYKNIAIHARAQGHKIELVWPLLDFYNDVNVPLFTDLNSNIWD